MGEFQGAVDLGSPIARAIQGFSTRAQANEAVGVILIAVLPGGQVFYDAAGLDPIYRLGMLSLVKRLITDGLMPRPPSAPLEK